MMTFGESIRVICNSFERLCEALLDKNRADRVMLLLLATYCSVWTIYECIARSCQDLHPDMTEIIAWSRDLSLGYLKHPPLAAWLVHLWFSAMPLADWSYYLLAVLIPTVALAIFWQLSADYLTLPKRVAGVAMLTLFPFYNFHALKYNPNTILLPTWTVTTYWFLRSYRTQSPTYSALTGIGAAASVLGKYWSIFLLAGLLLGALLDSRRREYFRSAAPWISVTIGLALLGPHFAWLYQNGFVPFRYALARHTSHSITASATHVFGYLLGCVGYAALPTLLILALARPSRKAIIDIIRPKNADRQLILIIFLGPLLLPIIPGLFADLSLTSLWSMSAWTLLPIVLLSSSEVHLMPMEVRRIIALALAASVAMLITAPLVAIGRQAVGVSPEEADAHMLAIETENIWHQNTTLPLRFVGCDAADEVIAYAQDRPRQLPLRYFAGDGSIADNVYAAAYNWPAVFPDDPRVNADITRSGMALVCSVERENWLFAAKYSAGQNPKSQRSDVEITHSYLGIAGHPHRYAIFIFPPAL